MNVLTLLGGRVEGVIGQYKNVLANGVLASVQRKSLHTVQLIGGESHTSTALYFCGTS